MKAFNFGGDIVWLRLIMHPLDDVAGDVVFSAAASPWNLCLDEDGGVVPGTRHVRIMHGKVGLDFKNTVKLRDRHYEAGYRRLYAGWSVCEAE